MDIFPDARTILERVLAKLDSWTEAFIDMLPNVVLAVLATVAFGLLGRLLGRLAAKAVRRWTSHDGLAGLVGTVSRLAVIAVGLFIALDLLSLEKTVTSLLAGVGVVGLALGFAFQDIASNFMSGVIMGVRRPLAVGDIIKTNEVFGTVHELGLRATQIETFAGQLALVPNKDVLQKPLLNYSKLGRRRVDIPCGVSYASELERAREVAIAAIEEQVEERDTSKPVQFVYTGFGASSIDFELRFWLDLERGHDFLEARSAAIIAIRRAFDEAGVTIPFPIRTLDFGIQGGQTLGEVAPKLQLADDSEPSSPRRAS